MEVRYFGWSGIAVSHQGLTVGFDLPADAASFVDERAGEGEMALCVTHGHPDHCAGLRALLAAGRRSADEPVLVGPAAVVEYGARSGEYSSDRLRSVEPGDETSIGGGTVTAFEWQHLPVLPPGLSPKLSYLRKLLGRPGEVVRIAASGAGLPVRSTTLGFHIRFSDGHTVLNYAEGLHHRTAPDEVAEVSNRLSAEVLLLAVEPEGVEAIPRWIAILEPEVALLYEAHRPWREIFDLPELDLDGYREELAADFPELAVGTLTRTGERKRLG